MSFELKAALVLAGVAVAAFAWSRYQRQLGEAREKAIPGVLLPYKPPAGFK